MKPSRLLLLGAFALLASCEDMSGPDGLFAGTVTFNFTGAGGGTFNVTGGIPLSEDNFYRQDWAIGARDDAEGVVGVTAVRAQGGGDFDQVLITIPRVTPGSATIEANCTDTDCAAFAFILGSHEDDILSFEQSCVLTAGTLTIATLSSSRATGSFSGFGVCTSGSNVDTDFTVSSGTFDVVVGSGI
ncbi:MAG: hypothetical protein ACREOK_03690 [Gemmatimonadaceae bacterium]